MLAFQQFIEYICISLNFLLLSVDLYDKNIIMALQQNGRISNKDLAEQVALSPAPCWRRVDALQKSGLIKGYSVVLDQEKLGLNITAFAFIALDNHHPETVKVFDECIRQWPEVLECHATSGEHDYLLKIVTADMQSYNQLIYDHILSIPHIRSINTSFSMRQKKTTAHLPLNQVADQHG